MLPSDTTPPPTRPHADPGLFIVLDGGEGCGKSTQAQLLRKLLESSPPGSPSRPVHVFRDPGTTRVGEMIRAILLNPDHTELAFRCEMLLYMAARAQMMSETILPLLAKGDAVICDRFVSSTLAYQLGGEGLSTLDIENVANIAIQQRWPDITIILDMTVERAVERITRRPAPKHGWKDDRIQVRPLHYHELVRQRFLALAQAHPALYQVVDADRPPNDVAQNIAGIVERMLLRSSPARF